MAGHVHKFSTSDRLLVKIGFLTAANACRINIILGRGNAGLISVTISKIGVSVTTYAQMRGHILDT